MARNVNYMGGFSKDAARNIERPETYELEQHYGSDISCTPGQKGGSVHGKAGKGLFVFFHLIGSTMPDRGGQKLFKPCI